MTQIPEILGGLFLGVAFVYAFIFTYGILAALICLIAHAITAKLGFYKSSHEWYEAAIRAKRLIDNLVPKIFKG